MPKSSTLQIKKTISKANLSFLIFVLFALAILLMVNNNLVLYTNNLGENNEKKENVLAYETDNSREIEFWQKFLRKNPEYYPGWLELAKLEFESGNLLEAGYAIENAEELKPNAQELLEFKKILTANQN